jgi:predicted nucleic acid-binding protein
MRELIRHPRHHFWPDAISLLLEAGQLSDTYLLALAVHHGGTLVSFDRRLGGGAVAGGSAALRLIPT